jgi:hypothetical protein
VKKITFAIMLVSVLAWAGDDVNPADYTVKVHVSASGTANNMQELSVVIKGKHFNLESQLGTPDKLLALGDYQAKLVQDEHKTAYDSHQVYEFLFPDKKTRKFVIVGETE